MFLILYFSLQAYFSALGDVKSFGLDPDSSGQIVTGKRTYLIEYFDDRCASRAYLDISQAEVSHATDGSNCGSNCGNADLAFKTRMLLWRLAGAARLHW